MENQVPIFEQASRLKLRFDTSRGSLSVEDLWDLPLTSPSGNRINLDSLAVELYRATKGDGEAVSFVTPAATDAAAERVALQFALVKHVLDVKLAERDARAAESARREKKQRILELIAQKQDEALGAKSEEELLALANSL